MTCNGQPQPERTDDHDAANLVAQDDACPKCGERHVDHLAWLDDEVVHCTSCGADYEPSAP